MLSADKPGQGPFRRGRNPTIVGGAAPRYPRAGLGDDDVRGNHLVYWAIWFCLVGAFAVFCTVAFIHYVFKYW